MVRGGWPEYPVAPPGVDPVRVYLNEPVEPAPVMREIRKLHNRGWFWLTAFLLLCAMNTAGVLALHHYSAIDARRAKHLTRIVNARCNRVHQTIDDVVTRKVGPALMAYVELDLPDCASSLAALRAAGGSTEAILRAVPWREPDDPELADRRDP